MGAGASSSKTATVQPPSLVEYFNLQKTLNLSLLQVEFLSQRYQSLFMQSTSADPTSMTSLLRRCFFDKTPSFEEFAVQACRWMKMSAEQRASTLFHLITASNANSSLTKFDLWQMCSRLKPENPTVGQLATISGSSTGYKGTIRFIGKTKFATGEWVGLELDEPSGKNDGSVHGERYFTCKPKHGLFAPLDNILPLCDASIPEMLMKQFSEDPITEKAFLAKVEPLIPPLPPLFDTLL